MFVFRDNVWPMLVTLLVLGGLDFVLGVLVAIRQHTFEWKRLADFLLSNGAPILGWLAVEVILALPQVPFPLEDWALTGVYGTVFLAIFASVAGHLSALGVLRPLLSKLGVTPTTQNSNG